MVSTEEVAEEPSDCARHPKQLVVDQTPLIRAAPPGAIYIAPGGATNRHSAKRCSKSNTGRAEAALLFGCRAGCTKVPGVKRHSKTRRETYIVNFFNAHVRLYGKAKRFRDHVHHNEDLQGHTAGVDKRARQREHEYKSVRKRTRQMQPRKLNKATPLV